MADTLAQNDEEAIALARQSIASTNFKPIKPIHDFQEPNYDAGQLYGVIPADLRQAFDVREIIMRLIDGF